MNSNTESPITIVCYGDGTTYPLRIQVEVSLEDTVMDMKDDIFHQAEDEGFNMARIDKQSVIVVFREDDDESLCFYLDTTKVKDFDCKHSFALLPGFLLGFELDEAMLHIDNTILSPFYIEVFLRDKEEPRSSWGELLEVSHDESVIGVKELIIQDLCTDQIISADDVLLIFSVPEVPLKYVSTPVETRIWRTGRNQFSMSVEDTLKVKTFMGRGSVTVVDVLFLNGQMEINN
ncbi:hypothetical protein BG000_011621 [Podila horticola]|nr:hypothetical protein BG000_011621 [Podila horticola]